MRTSQLRLLPVSAVLLAGVAMPSAAAVAEPAAPSVAHVERASAPVAQRLPDLGAPTPEQPPLWLLLLLAPVLVGGAIGVGVTLHRLR